LEPSCGAAGKAELEGIAASVEAWMSVMARRIEAKGGDASTKIGAKFTKFGVFCGRSSFRDVRHDVFLYCAVPKILNMFIFD